MNKDLHDIDDLFKNSIDGHAEDVPADVWKNIDHSLDKKQAAFYKRKYFTVRAAAILLLLVGGVTIAAILHFNNKGRNIQSGNNESSVATSVVSHKNSEQQKEIPGNASKNSIPENNSNDQHTITLNNEEVNGVDASQSNNKRIGARKTNVKEYGSTNNSNYSAQKNGEITAVSNGRTKKQRNISKYKPVPKTSVDLIAQQPGNIVEQDKAFVTSNDVKEKSQEIKSFSRTTFVQAKYLKTNKVDLAAFFPSVDLKNSISFPASSSLTKKLKNKFSLKNWSVSPLYAQNINLNTLKDDDHFRDPRNNSREARRTEQRTTSFTAGLGVQKELGKNIALQTGVQYFSSQTDIQPKTIFAKPDDHGDVRYQFRCSSGDSYLSSKTGMAPSIGDSIETSYSKSMLSYLQLPLMVSYKINFGRFSFMPSAGLQTNFLLSGELNSSLSNSTGEEEVSSSIKGLKSMYWSGVIQPQFNYKLNDQISFDFSPNINFSFSPINKETAVKTYQNMLSLGAGVRIKL